MTEDLKPEQARPHKERRISGCSCGLLGIGGVVIGILLVFLGLIGVGAVLIVADPVEPVDAVVVLSGGTGDRLALAIEMHADGIAPNLVITDADRTANARLRAEAIEGGFAREDVYITDLPVDSTEDEAVAVREFAQAQGWTRLMVVTDPYHSFRTRLIFRQVLRDSGIDVFVRPVAGHWFRSTTWFLQAEGWQFVFLEIAKLANYLLF